MEEKKELTLEEQEKVQEFIEQMFQRNNKNAFRQISEYLRKNKISVNDAVNEVLNKQSNLPARARAILESTKLDLLEKWFPQV